MVMLVKFRHAGLARSPLEERAARLSVIAFFDVPAS
jgi:hypothetical protein